MSGEKGKIVFGPWSNQNDLPRLPLPEFLRQAREYLKVITSIQQDVQHLSTIFDIGQDVWPDQCEYAINTLNIAKEPIHCLCKLLNTVVPLSVIPLRYPLIVALYHVSEQIEVTSAFIDAFRTFCRAPSQRVIRQQQEIRRKIEFLMQNSEEVIHLILVLIDQAQFEERKLTQPAPPSEDDSSDDLAAISVQTDNFVAANSIPYFVISQRKRLAAREVDHSSNAD